MAKRRSRKRKIPVARRKSRRTPWLFLVLITLVGINCYVFLWRGGTSIPDVMEQAAVAGDPSASPNIDKVSADPLAKSAKATSDDSLAETKASVRKVSGEVASGESLGGILTREGLDANAADELIRSLSGHLDFRKIQAGQKYHMTFDGEGKLVLFEFEVTRVERVRSRRGEDGHLSSDVWRATTEIRHEEVGGTIESSLYHSIKRSGEDIGLVSFFVDLFAYDLDFYVDTHPGDKFRLIVAKEYYEGDFLGYKQLLAAEYQGSAGHFKALWWEDKEHPELDEAGYFTVEGESLEKTFLKTPLKFARISSRFNPRRMHPVLHKRRGHFGVDYAAPTGTPIWAAANGRIVQRGRRGGGGNTVTIQHGNGLQTTYMHMVRFEKGQSVGTRVQAKDIIGYVGSTGLATGPHLHFGVKKDGRHIDPFKLKMKRSRHIETKRLPSFKADTAELVASLSKISFELEPNPFVLNLNPAG